jgi:hypothetical protein
VGVPLVTGTDNPNYQVSLNNWNNVVHSAPVTPRYFGAIGDGVADDTAALQAFLTSPQLTAVTAIIVAALTKSRRG